ncbi:complement factor D-like isoform X2 [Daphnia pulex]|uniref:complement factor D-like isoform X2 n=1 Tax=Daphnia pulex TaxID=6669 RepID=UPI001EE13767|nr:complement factor D-like isoform X2 [Daphnia pulex]
MNSNCLIYKCISFEKKAMLYALVFTIFVTFVSGAPNEELGRIIGGSEANRTGQFPYVVSISLQDQHICGGFIYNDGWVVTAAECVHGKNQGDLKITIGALSLITPNPGEQVIGVYKLIEFSQFDPVSLMHNIALIQLTRPIEIGPTAQPIRYGEIDELAIPWDAYIVGWGALNDGGSPATRLRWAPIDDLAADCGIFSIDEFQPDSMICAGSTTGTISPCQYDEGSPLTQRTNSSGISKEIVVGIMSKNKGCADPSLPTIYTRLSTYYSWILHTAGPQLLK